MSDEPVRKKFYAYPELTPCADFVANAGAVVFFILFALMASAVPWEWLYSREWYRAWIDVAANWSPNIRMLPSSPSRIVEQASAYLAFANTLGPFYLAVTIRCGWRHGANPVLHERNWHIKTRNLVKYSLVAAAGVLLTLYGTLWWEGTSPELHHTDIFYRSGPAFISLHAVFWWATGICAYGFMTLVRILGGRWFSTYR